MNIFLLSYSPEQAARYHCDQHVSKMLLETCQILSNPYYRHIGAGQKPGKLTEQQQKDLRKYRLKLGDKNPDSLKLYGVSHAGHGSVLWVNNSLENWKWACDLGNALFSEYCKRTSKNTHGCLPMLKWLNHHPPIHLPKQGFTEPYLAFGPHENIKFKGKPVKSYRHYYVVDKAKFNTKGFAKWYGSTSDTPKWFKRICQKLNVEHPCW